MTNVQCSPIAHHPRPSRLKRNRSVEDLGLDFTVTYAAEGWRMECDLAECGATRAVTDDNKAEYLQARLRHRLLDCCKAQLEHLLAG